MPSFLLGDVPYDFLVPLILYVGIYRPVREGVVVALVTGFVMDNLSAGPFGVYGAAYIWMFVASKWMTTFLQMRRNRFLLSFAVALGVLLENLIFLGAFAVSGAGFGIPGDAVRVVGGQTLWGMGTGVFLILLINYAHEKWDGWFRARLSKES